MFKSSPSFPIHGLLWRKWHILHPGELTVQHSLLPSRHRELILLYYEENGSCVGVYKADGHIVAGKLARQHPEAFRVSLHSALGSCAQPSHRVAKSRVSINDASAPFEPLHLIDHHLPEPTGSRLLLLQLRQGAVLRERPEHYQAFQFSPLQQHQLHSSRFRRASTARKMPDKLSSSCSLIGHSSPARSTSAVTSAARLSTNTRLRPARQVTRHYVTPFRLRDEMIMSDLVALGSTVALGE